MFEFVEGVYVLLKVKSLVWECDEDVCLRGVVWLLALKVINGSNAGRLIDHYILPFETNCSLKASFGFNVKYFG